MPLSYEATKLLIGYLDVHPRFQLALNCPSLRTTEKLIPLKIDRLDLTGPSCISVNGHDIELQKLKPHLLQLTISSPRGKDIMRFKCSMDLESAMKQLISLLFSNRRDLSVNCLHVCPNLLTPTVKFQVRNLNLAKSCYDIRELDSNIDQNSPPLDVLGIHCHPRNFRNWEHPTVRNAKKLIFHYPYYDAAFSNIYQGAHRHIHLSLTDNAKGVWHVLNGVINEWRRNWREIGDVFSFYIKTEFFIQLMKKFDSILSRVGGERIDLWTMVVPLNDAIQIQIRFEGVIHYDGIDEDADYLLHLPHVYMRAEGYIVLRVVPVDE
ncbi:hypothetical protein CAEBREN_02955 [Caenorhabditis brenneri]|uniref:F-box domain-containing protein n=1 Tax=Caenorhabditis brenneri TaxID=135651 RepID=G0MMM0_CAEBE|nr:hypothetical protein CAEBREN_02955 [Caenorhabditis brenneri]